MIELVSNVPANRRVGVLDRISQDQLSSPGAYSKNYSPPSPIMPSQYSSPYQQNQYYNKEDGGFLGFLGKVIILAAVIVTGSILARRYVPSLNKLNVTEELTKDAKPMEKIKYDFVKFADWLEKNTIGLFKKSK